MESDVPSWYGSSTVVVRRGILMNGERRKFMRNAMLLVALFAVFAVGFVAFESDDAFADSSGDVISNEKNIGTWTF
ncbi:MAG: hypothetical protein J6R75_04405, partial [Candidatus Methanomethylophilaceae archaeon]|nr:hypothetical protein [Candidatus Methanomethylophilaceae archaeon]